MVEITSNIIIGGINNILKGSPFVNIAKGTTDPRVEFILPK